MGLPNNTCIVYQHTGIAYKIGMELLYLKVVNAHRGFKQLMLYLLYHNIFAVAHHQDVARTQFDCGRPPLCTHYTRIKGACVGSFISSKLFYIYLSPHQSVH